MILRFNRWILRARAKWVLNSKISKESRVRAQIIEELIKKVVVK